jgi:hypothetical protein
MNEDFTDAENNLKKIYRAMMESETFDGGEAKVVSVAESAMAIDNKQLIVDLIKKALLLTTPRLQAYSDSVYQSVGKAFGSSNPAEIDSMVADNPSAKEALQKLEAVAMAIDDLDMFVKSMG